MNGEGSGFLTFLVNGTNLDAFPGVQITPAQNSFPTYAQIMAAAAVTEDCYGVEIIINDGDGVGTARDILVNIGIDPAGGTSYTTRIPALLGSAAGDLSLAQAGGGGHNYYFPLFIKAGSSIAAQASVNNATLGNVRVFLKLYCKPTKPHLLRCGVGVESIGVTLASSRGTLVTPGTSSGQGTWTLLAALANDCWYFETSMGINDISIGNGWFFLDLARGDATNKDILIFNQRVITSSAEVINKLPMMGQNQIFVPADTNIYGRISNSQAANDTQTSQAAWGVYG